MHSCELIVALCRRLGRVLPHGRRAAGAVALAVAWALHPAAAVTMPQTQTPSEQTAPTPAARDYPEDYVVGPDDVLLVTFWREPEMSGEVLVRSDGKISLPLINEIPVIGLSPDQLRARLEEAAKKFVAEPSVSVAVKAINSRRVFLTGEVSKPGAYSVSAPLTVLQLIALGGGFGEYAKRNQVMVIRQNGGVETAHRFNYDEVIRGKNIAQNLTLKPGDTVIVP